MGMRQNIGMKYKEGGKIYIHSYHDGNVGNSLLKQKLRTALARKRRWNDESYLARIIVSEIIKDDINSDLGYGIMPYPLGEDFPTIEVDFEKQTVDGISFEKFIEE